MREHRFPLLNETYSLPAPIDWTLKSHPQASHLGRFHLHYHEYLLDFLRSGSPPAEDLELAWSIIGDWVAAHPFPNRDSLSDGWHPFCISRRIPVWLSLWSVHPPAEEVQNSILQSLFKQGQFLARYLERDVGGNHLLENLRTLGLLSLFFQGSIPETWQQQVEHELRQEIPRQILPHGEHFELAPFYHLEMLDVFLDLADLFRQLQSPLAEECQHTATRMRQFLRSILHPRRQPAVAGGLSSGRYRPD